MAGIGKELLRRISLVDLVEEHSLSSKAVKELNITKTAKRLTHLTLLARTGSRAILRCIGDSWAAAGVYDAAQDPENLPKYMGIGALAFAVIYLMDYAVYDRYRIL
ncbi:MAG: hypothetical protein AABW48_06425 [Nanoarchaeota archaeon]